MKKWYRPLVWLLVLSMMLGMVACNDGIFPPAGGIPGADQTPGEEPGDIPDVDPDDILDVDPDDIFDVDPDDIPEIDPDDIPEIDPDDIPEIDPDDVPEIDPDDIPDLDGDVTATEVTYALKGDGTYEVTGVTALGDTVVAVIIPSVHEGRAVTSIGARAFYNCADILSVVIPGSVKTIGSEAFFGCSSLMSIAIPDSVETIGTNAFDGCSGLYVVQIGKGLQTVEWDVFAASSATVTIFLDAGNPHLTVEDGWKLVPKVDVTQKFSVLIQFVAPNGLALESPIERRNIGYGEEVRLPSGYMNNVTRFADYVLIGWDSDGDGEADNGYQSVKKNFTLNAVFRPKMYYSVKFYDTATHYTEITVKEGSAVDLSAVPIPTTVGRVFRQWVDVDTTDRTTLSCVGNDASFAAQYQAINSIIPMVEKNTIKVDGKKDEAYKNGTYLPVNEERHADRKEGTYTQAVYFRPTVHNGPIPGTDGEMSSWITADAWLVWDGDYIYMLVEVSDKTLTYRNPKYVHLNVNAWLNDNVECYYSFEQNASGGKNYKKLGLDAMSQKLFANSIAQYGKNSTHYADMAGAARCAYGYYENGVRQTYDETDGLTADVALLRATDYVGVQYGATLNASKNYSYRVEFRFAAKTEGVPNKAHYPVDDNGRLPAGYVLGDGSIVPVLTDSNDPDQVRMEYYRFTDGEKLQAGSLVRFNLQINDLMVTLGQLLNPNSGYYEGDPDDDEQMRRSFLYRADGVTEVYPPFVPCGNTQYDLEGYVAYLLGDENSVAKWEVYELKGSGIETEMRDAYGNLVVQGSTLVTVQIAK